MRSGAARGEVGQTLERDRQMRAALVVDHGVDLVDDHRRNRAQHPAATVRGEQDVERLRCRHQDVRRLLEHRGARRGRGVAGADRGPDRDLGLAAFPQPLEDAGERLLEVALDVVRQRLERRHVDDLGTLGKLASGGDALADQVVDHRQERGQGLAGTGRCRDQSRPPHLDRGPGLQLRRRAGRGSPRTTPPPRDGRGRAGDVDPVSLAASRTGRVRLP